MLLLVREDDERFIAIRWPTDADEGASGSAHSTELQGNLPVSHTVRDKTHDLSFALCQPGHSSHSSYDVAVCGSLHRA